MTWTDYARRGLAVGWCLLALLAATIHAEATFYLTETETQFGLTLANDSSDVFLFFTSPAYSWVGVGFGESMKNSLSFIMYPNKADNNVTVSPRIATGNSEPTFAPEIQLDVLNGTGITDDMFVLKAVCHNCRSWRGGQIDTTALAHPMIYAFGPATGIQSNDPNAGLKRHTRYGTFDMNMVAATGKGEVPAPNAALNGVTLRTGPVKDHHRKDLAHSILGCIAIFVLWPLNVVAAGFLRNIRIHIGLSVFVLIFLTISYALGISISSEFNRSKSYTSPHQLLAFLTLLPILLLSVLPTKPLSSLTPHIPRLHAPLTTLTFTLLVIAGGLGLALGQQPTTLTLSFAAVAVAVFVFMTLLQLCIRRRGSAYARATTRRRLGEEDEQDFGLAKWGVGREMGSVKAAGRQEGSQGQPQGQWVNGQWVPDAGHQQGQHARSASAGSPYGGGTMPGPQYLLNMHPGVPVHKW